jgi:hypothetical protein
MYSNLEIAKQKTKQTNKQTTTIENKNKKGKKLQIVFQNYFYRFRLKNVLLIVCDLRVSKPCLTY